MATTNTWDFGNTYASDFVLDAFERCQWRTASLTPDMLISAQRSFNFVQSRWSNLGVNLWEVSLETITLSQGVATYTLDPTTLAVLPEAYVNQWNLSQQTSLATNSFSTTALSTTVTITQASNGLTVGAYINVATPFSIGGVTISGFYAVASTPTTSTYTIELASAATGTVSAGVVPIFNTDGTTSTVTVSLPNQPYLAGQTFNVEVPVTVGGLTLQGQYLVTAAFTNSFTFSASQVSTSATSAAMNGGLPLIESQTAAQLPTARVLYPMSRPDYASLSVKGQQGMPTSFWFDRLATPQITFWPVPDANGPYQFQYYKLSQMQDASIQGGATVDIPYRFCEAYVAACAAHIAMKWRPDLFGQLSQYAQQVWMEASEADREKVSSYIGGDLSGYFG